MDSLREISIGIAREKIKKKERATADLSAFTCSFSLTLKISKGSYTSGRSYVSADSCRPVFFPFLIFLTKKKK